MFLQHKPGEDEPTSWLWVGLWLLFIYVSIPLARTVQEAVRDRGGEHLFLWLTLVFIVLLAGLVLRLLGSRKGSCTPARLVVIGAVFVAYGWFTWMLRANPEEAFHFVQYGVLGILIFRALSHRIGDPSIYFVAAMAGMLFGAVDELLQWIVPRRFFDFRDIAINALAVALVQVALGAGLKPAYIRGRAGATGLRIGWSLAAFNGLLLLFCANNTPHFMEVYARWIPSASHVDESTAEYGYLIGTKDTVMFKSRLSAEELSKQDLERGEEVGGIIKKHYNRWRYLRFLDRTPAHTAPLAVEARSHVYWRDYHVKIIRDPETPPETASASARISQGENAILTRYFSNTLAHSTYAWPRDMVLPVTVDDITPYYSPYQRHIITWVTRQQLSVWLVLFTLAALMAERWMARRRGV